MTLSANQSKSITPTYTATDDESIAYSGDPRLDQFFLLMLDQHPAFDDLGYRAQDIETILRSFASVLNALNPIRNRASVAHPNENLLEEPEAMLVINAARTVLHYVDSRIQQHSEYAG